MGLEFQELAPFISVKGYEERSEEQKIKKINGMHMMIFCCIPSIEGVGVTFIWISIVTPIIIGKIFTGKEPIIATVSGIDKSLIHKNDWNRISEDVRNI